MKTHASTLFTLSVCSPQKQYDTNNSNSFYTLRNCMLSTQKAKKSVIAINLITLSLNCPPIDNYT